MGWPLQGLIFKELQRHRFVDLITVLHHGQKLNPRCNAITCLHGPMEKKLGGMVLEGIEAESGRKNHVKAVTFYDCC